MRVRCACKSGRGWVVQASAVRAMCFGEERFDAGKLFNQSRLRHLALPQSRTSHSPSRSRLRRPSGLAPVGPPFTIGAPESRHESNGLVEYTFGEQGPRLGETPPAQINPFDGAFTWARIFPPKAIATPRKLQSNGHINQLVHRISPETPEQRPYDPAGSQSQEGAPET